MKLSGTTFFASALALLAGCSSGSSEAPRVDDAARNTESLSAASRRGPEADPCAAVRCRAGTECVVVDGAATCAETEPDIGACAAVTCLEGNSCEVIDGEPVCVSNDAAACAAVTCLEGNSCEIVDGEPACVPNDVSACAAVLCGPGTFCHEVDGEGVCTPIEPEVDACATVRCGAGTECVVVDGQAECQPVEASACAAVLCEAGSTCEVVDGEAQCTPQEPSGPFCGGFGGIECPGLGMCLDDPADDCDPENGGADCGGLCACNVRVLCVPGLVFDESAAVCDCVPEPETNPCALVDCFPNQTCEVIEGEAVCVALEPNPCAAVLCPVDTVCIADGDEARCVHPDQCN